LPPRSNATGILKNNQSDTGNDVENFSYIKKEEEARLA